MFLLLDNYDSFTYNVFHLLARHVGSQRVVVRRNDELSVGQAMALGDEGIFISPGPCTPESAGISIELIKECARQKKPLFGICLGLQAMVVALGGAVAPYQPPRHGKLSTMVTDHHHWLWKNLPPAWQATRYHSLAVVDLPQDLITIAHSQDDNQVMAVSHRDLPMVAVQFHPESHFSENSDKMIENFLYFISAPNMAELGGEKNNNGKNNKNNMKSATEKLLKGQDLTPADMTQAIDRMMMGDEAVEDMVAFLKALTDKGITADDLTSAAMVMRRHAAKITAPDGAIDIVGTGGDLKGTLNISTASAFVVAGLGVPIAKHGNRAITSQAGTADVQSALGINVDYSLDRVALGMADIGFAFCFAPKHHAATRHVMPARKLLAEQKIKTIFNLLGPLTNPASVKYYLIGVYDRQWLKPMAQALDKMGASRAWLVHGLEGLDEISITGETAVVTLDRGKITEATITPAMAGLPTHDLDSIKGGDGATNAKAITDLLSQTNLADCPEGLTGFRDAVLLNAGAGLVIAGKADDLKQGVILARESIETGKALKKLQDFADWTNK